VRRGQEWLVRAEASQKLLLSYEGHSLEGNVGKKWQLVIHGLFKKIVSECNGSYLYNWV